MWTIEIFQTLSIIVLAGFVLRTRSRLPIEEKANYQCTCQHFFNAHTENGTGKCNVVIRDGYHSKIGNCACLFYIGPKPPPEINLEDLWPGVKKDKTTE